MEQANVYQELKLIKSVNYFMEMNEEKATYYLYISKKSQMQTGPFQKTFLQLSIVGIKTSKELLLRNL